MHFFLTPYTTTTRPSLIVEALRRGDIVYFQEKWGPLWGSQIASGIEDIQMSNMPVHYVTIEDGGKQNIEIYIILCEDIMHFWEKWGPIWGLQIANYWHGGRTKFQNIRSYPLWHVWFEDGQNKTACYSLIIILQGFSNFFPGDPNFSIKIWRDPNHANRNKW